MSNFLLLKKHLCFYLRLVKSSGGSYTYYLVMAFIRWTCDPSPVRQSPRGSWGRWSQPRPGFCPRGYRWPRRRQRRCRRWGSRMWVPGSSRHWTTSRRWSTAGWTGCRWGRGSCTWAGSCCRQERRCGKPDSRRQCPHSTLEREDREMTDHIGFSYLLSVHCNQIVSLGARRIWGSPLRALQGYFGLKISW